jgi:nicotinamide-nucleotide amidase
MTAAEDTRLWTAEIIAVGSELLVPPRLDTNSLAITRALAGIGIVVRAKAVVGDRVDDVARLVEGALGRSDLVVLCGGLGPTDDDVTRDAVSSVLGVRLVEDAAIVAKLRARFASRGYTMPEINRRQALVLDGAHVLDNANGTAPGQWIDHGGRVVLLLPGPPRELEPMLEALVADRLGRRAPASRVHTRGVFMTGLTESHAEEMLQPLYRAWSARAVAVEATILATAGQLELHLFARAEAVEAAAALTTAVDEVSAALGDHVFSLEGRPLEEVVGGMLAARGWRIALAESCTGGLATSRLTDVAGSSAWVERSVVAYSNAAKTGMLGVPETLIAGHGAVSEPVALAMAEGVKRLAGVEIGVGITGIAGPSGGSDAKPVGTVCLAVVAGETQSVRTVRYPGGRAQVKFHATQGALDLVRRVLQRTAVPD